MGFVNGLEPACCWAAERRAGFFFVGAIGARHLSRRKIPDGEKSEFLKDRDGAVAPYLPKQRPRRRGRRRLIGEEEILAEVADAEAGD